MASRSARPSIACSRRDWFGHAQHGLMAIALSQLASDSLLAQSIDASTDKAPHHQSRAKAVIQLYMQGGPSQMDLLDPRPLLAKYEGMRC